MSVPTGERRRQPTVDVSNDDRGWITTTSSTVITNVLRPNLTRRARRLPYAMVYEHDLKKPTNFKKKKKKKNDEIHVEAIMVSTNEYLDFLLKKIPAIMLLNQHLIQEIVLSYQPS